MLEPATKRSLWFLVAANLVPLIGIVFFDWQAAEIIFGYWIETIVIVHFAIKKMKRAERMGMVVNVKIHGRLITQTRDSLIRAARYQYYVPIAFYLVFLPLITGIGYFPDVHSATFRTFLLAIATLGGSLIVSHWLSYRLNFIGAEEYRRISVAELFWSPFKRLLVLHITVVFAALVGVPAIMFVIIKTGMDIWFHVLAHKITDPAEKSILDNFS